MRDKRIVITGIGVVSPVGIGKEAFWEGLKQGRSGIRPVTLFDTSDMRVKSAGVTLPPKVGPLFVIE